MLRSTGPGHGPTDIEDDRGAEVGLLLELFDDPFVRARGNLPVDEAQVIAWLVPTILRELHRKPLFGGPVQAREKTIDHPARNDLDVAELREAGRVEEVGAYGAGIFHRGGKITAAGE